MYNSIIHGLRKLKFKYKGKESYEQLDLDNSSIKLFWFKEILNFGDYLNFDLMSKLSQKKVEWVPNHYHDEYFMAVGSVLQLATDKTVVWGSGLISDRYLPLASPREILAVRGPLTRGRLKHAKIKCPEIYGDPALIMPEIYFPKIDKIYDLGVIPHYVDKKNKFFEQKFNPNIKVIDISQPNFEGFINEVLSCKKIISSSLHGLIIADAYDIPALRIEFSKEVVGGDFKFNDYFLSVNRECKKAILIKENTEIKKLLDLNFSYKKSIDIKRLIEVSPFL
jgi:pyruvyltransferase